MHICKKLYNSTMFATKMIQNKEEEEEEKCISNISKY